MKYLMQDNDDVVYKYFRIFCDTNHFLSLPFCGTHINPHGVEGLSKNYHMRFDTKLGHGICTIFQIPCACDKFTYMSYKPWTPG